MESLGAFIFAVVVTLFFTVSYLKKHRAREARAREAAERGKLFSDGPRGMHPHIDTNHCIGCGTCTSVCPEGDVLAMLGGQAAIVNGHKCIGHSLCADACPVGAITMVKASPSMSKDLPSLTPEFETTIKDLFIVGELGGLALIKNAVNEGRDCIDVIARRLQSRPLPHGTGLYDVLIVGAGPAGISASLRAIEKKLNYITLERDEVGGTVAKFPRQKLVMTSPVQFPMYGKFNKLQLSKEHLLAFWDMILNRSDFHCSTGEKVEDILKLPDGTFTVRTSSRQYRARAVVLALGRAGEPRKLGIKGEELPKVMYRLIEADHYIHKRILVVGGGDSAVEAAMGLAQQKGNTVTLSYRQEQFGRVKERNLRRIEECMKSGKIKVIFNSLPVEFKPDSAVLDVSGRRHEIPNDFVWIFAGGQAPNEFLNKIGVRLGARDMTLEGGQESRRAEQERRQFTAAGF
ncbi:MAG TPA: NAD(P)-binding domain-containing protein [Candidatus Angelobacter sp.]|nr:NAD(P)-binding domain-containing protein [Candidatus Angelobacter sp.]